MDVPWHSNSIIDVDVSDVIVTLVTLVALQWKTRTENSLQEKM